MKEYFVYMVRNKGRTTLYIGVTNSLIRRVSQHREGEISGFSKRYGTNRLVYYEKFNDGAMQSRARSSLKDGRERRKKH